MITFTYNWSYLVSFRVKRITPRISTPRRDWCRWFTIISNLGCGFPKFPHVLHIRQYSTALCSLSTYYSPTYTYRHVVEKLFSVNFNKRIHARFCLIVTNNNARVFFAKWNDARFVHIEQYWRLLRTGSIALHVFVQCRCNTKSSTLYRE